MEYEVKKILKPALYADILRVTDGDTDFTAFNGRTVLVTGASKLLGFYTVMSLLISNDLYNSSINVIAVDCDEKLFEAYGKLTYRQDIDFVVSRDYSELTADRCDYLIHAESSAAHSGINASLNILDFIRSRGCSSVILSGSDIYGSVYNGKDEITETDMGYSPLAGKHSAAVSCQRMTESLVLSLCRDEETDIKLGRTALIFGYKSFGNDFVDKSCHEIILEALQGRNIIIDTKTSVPQSYIYVTDAVEAVFTVLLKGESSGIYNIASGYCSSNFHFAEECARLFSDKEIKIIKQGNSVPLSPMSPTMNKLSCKKLLELGFEPKTDISSGIRYTAAIIKEESLC